MKNNLLIIIFISFAVSCTNKQKEYLCFSNPKSKDEKLCYPLSTNPSKDMAAQNAVIKLSKNIDNPGTLIKLEGEMLKRTTIEKAKNSVKKHFSWLNSTSISHLLTHDKYTAVYLKGNSTLYYNHDEKAFIFSYDQPMFFRGASHYFGRGLNPIKTKLTSTESICTLAKNGIVFVSPQKESFFYKEKETFCKYDNLFFTKQKNIISVKRIDQIGLNYTTLHGDFHKFLTWLQEKS